MPHLDDILALDLLTLREHTEHAGDVFDAASQREKLEQSLAACDLMVVHRQQVLIAYAMLQVQVQEGGLGFVLGFNTHPDHRNGSVFRELFARIARLARRRSITSLRSNVYKTNRRSMAFHRRLGFKVTRENTKGVEFTAELADLMSASPALARAGRGVR